MEVQESKYQKCVDENGREYLLDYDEKSKMHVRLYFTGEKNTKTIEILKEIIPDKMRKLTLVASKNTSV